MEITIRSANEGDIPALLEFEQGIIEAERPFDPTLKEGQIHYYDLHDLIHSPKVALVVALAEGQVVGSGYAKILSAKPNKKHREYAYLGFMYVKPEFRRQGVNEKVLDALMLWAKNNDITEIRLDVYHNNEAAKSAYSKAGFKPHLLEMRVSI